MTPVRAGSLHCFHQSLALISGDPKALKKVLFGNSKLTEIGNTGSLPCPRRPGYRFGQYLAQLFTVPQTSGFRRFHCLTFNLSRPSISGFISKKSALGSMIPRSNIMMHLMVEIKPLAPSRWLHAQYQRPSMHKKKSAIRGKLTQNLTSLTRYIRDWRAICDVRLLMQ